MDLHGRIKSIGHDVAKEVRRTRGVQMDPHKRSERNRLSQDNLPVLRGPSQERPRFPLFRHEDFLLATCLMLAVTGISALLPIARATRLRIVDALGHV